MIWTAPPKPAEIAEERIIDAILNGLFPVASTLPAERELAIQLGVTRPTLREALQRLARDGWIEIRQGRSTRVCDYWHEGNLGVLGAIASRTQHVPENFISDLLQVRILLAPAYARQAVDRAAGLVLAILAGARLLEDSTGDFAAFDRKLHHGLTVASGNPIFTLILNGFRGLYYPMACMYFEDPAMRRHSRAFYKDLEESALRGEPDRAEEVTRNVMLDSLQHWNSIKATA